MKQLLKAVYFEDHYIVDFPVTSEPANTSLNIHVHYSMHDEYIRKYYSSNIIMSRYCTTVSVCQK